MFENQSCESSEIPGNACSLFADGDEFLAEALVVRMTSEEVIHQFKHLRRVMKLRCKKIKKACLTRRPRGPSCVFHCRF